MFEEATGGDARFLTILKIIKNRQFLRVSDLVTRLEFVCLRSSASNALVGVQFHEILKISDFCEKFGFWVFWEATGHSGILGISIFLVFNRFGSFADFFVFFFGGLEI